MGSGSRDVDAWRADVSVRRGSGAPDADGPGACLSQPLGVGVNSLVFIHLIPRIDHKIRMVINRLNHLVLVMITRLPWWNTLNNKIPKECVQRDREAHFFFEKKLKKIKK